MATKGIQQPSPVRSKPAAPRENVLKKFKDETVKYLKGVKSELKRVTWPTRQELRYNTAIVLLVVVGISGYMWLVDQALGLLFRLLHRS